MRNRQSGSDPSRRSAGRMVRVAARLTAILAIGFGAIVTAPAAAAAEEAATIEVVSSSTEASVGPGVLPADAPGLVGGVPRPFAPPPAEDPAATTEDPAPATEDPASIGYVAEDPAPTTTIAPPSDDGTESTTTTDSTGESAGTSSPGASSTPTEPATSTDTATTDATGTTDSAISAGPSEPIAPPEAPATATDPAVDAPTVTAEPMPRPAPPVDVADDATAAPTAVSMSSPAPRPEQATIRAAPTGQHRHPTRATSPSHSPQPEEPAAQRLETRVALPAAAATPIAVAGEPLFPFDPSGPSKPTTGESVGAGVLTSGVAVVAPRVTAAVSVAMDFARLSGGWAGPLVFNVWLRRQMRERRLTQRQLGAISDVHHSTISRLVNGTRTPSLETASKLVHALRMEWTEDQVATYFDLLPERTLFPTQRVESALRGDTELDDADVRAVMAEYLARRTRLRAATRSVRRIAEAHASTARARDG